MPCHCSPHPNLWLPHNLKVSVRRNKPLRGVLSPQAGEGAAHSSKCRTSTASPAEPGGLPVGLVPNHGGMDMRVVAGGTLVLTPGADRHQSMMDVCPAVMHPRLTGVVTKIPESKTSSTASSMRFPDWCGLRSLTGTSAASMSAGANTLALAFARG